MDHCKNIHIEGLERMKALTHEGKHDFDMCVDTLPIMCFLKLCEAERGEPIYLF